MANKLTVEQAETLVDEVGNYLSWADVEVREGYSGRGMYGRECVAFVVDSNPTGVIVAMGYALAQLQHDYPDEWDDVDVSDLPTEMDNMGRGLVIY